MTSEERPPIKIPINTAPDINYVVRCWALRGWQNACMAAVPLYLAYTFTRKRAVRKPITVERILFASWTTGAAGAVAGGALGYTRYVNEDPHVLRRARVDLQFSEANIRRDGMAAIGGFLTGVIFPAVFWYQARLYNLVLGGAALGTIAGVTSDILMKVSNAPQTTNERNNTLEKEAAIQAGFVKPDE